MWGHDSGNYSRGQQCRVTTQGIIHDVSNVGSRLRELLTRSAMQGHDTGHYSRGQQCGVATEGVTHEVGNVGSGSAADSGHGGRAPHAEVAHGGGHQLHGHDVDGAEAGGDAQLSDHG